MGLDATADRMAETSRRTARSPRRGGLPNALFAVAAAEQPPLELYGRADELTILFPWGSLLRGALALPDASAASAGIAALVARGGTIRILVSVDARDRLGLPPFAAADRERLAAGWRCHGLEVCAFEPATDAEVRASGSTWARRLRAGRDRMAWRLDLHRR